MLSTRETNTGGGGKCFSNNFESIFVIISNNKIVNILFSRQNKIGH